MENAFGDRTTKVALGSPREAPRDHDYLLVFEHDAPHVFQLPATGTIVIGRAEDASLRLRDASVSRRHASVSRVDGRTELSDLKSHNGTQVNGKWLGEPRALASGDHIAIGAVTLIYHSSAVPVSSEPPQFRPLAEEIRELERARITAALVAAKGNQRTAARMLAMPLRTFVFKLRHHGLRRADTAR